MCTCVQPCFLQTRQKAAETRKTVLSGIKLAGETLGKGAAEFLGNREVCTPRVRGALFDLEVCEVSAEILLVVHV